MVYKGLTYATVKGAGHMVPADQPERALELFRVFLEGKQFNTSSPAQKGAFFMSILLLFFKYPSFYYRYWSREDDRD